MYWSTAATKSALVTTTHNLDNFDKNIKDLANGENQHPSFMELVLLILIVLLILNWCLTWTQVTILHSFIQSGMIPMNICKGNMLGSSKGLHKKRMLVAPTHLERRGGYLKADSPVYIERSYLRYFFIETKEG
jgi:hypothetical protein